MISNIEEDRQVCVSAPGKIILFGEHAVVLGKTAIATSLSLRAKIVITRNTENKLNLELPDLKEFGSGSWPLEEFRKLNDFPKGDIADPLKPFECNPEFLNQLLTFTSVKGIATFLFLFSAITQCTKGFNIKLSSDLPIGAGLGSSASFCVGLCGGLLEAMDIYACGKCDQCKGAHKNSDGEHNPCTVQSDLINLWSLQGEKLMHGTPSGIDNAVSTFGKALTFTRRAGYKILDRGIPPLRILITNTRVGRSTKILVENVINRSQKYTDLIDPVSNLIDTISMQCLACFERYEADSNFDELQSAMELMFDMNQSLLSGCYGVGHSSIDNIVSITKSMGLHTKLTGAGGGGCVITLLKPSTDSQQLEQLKKALSDAGYESWEATIGDPGVLIKSL
ncbi:hypothetical protein CYY_006393 [Polysphondylium violaceum]|uniref:Mevalonate kinase n=1 Tax=Polysphondylium violaceum TaxID=133409 RepID=A0A8J4URI7_9MYCE|nr:hypothetical protein CYY_006393 [Polysphondylium violaceum]